MENASASLVVCCKHSCFKCEHDKVLFNQFDTQSVRPRRIERIREVLKHPTRPSLDVCAPLDHQENIYERCFAGATQLHEQTPGEQNLSQLELHFENRSDVSEIEDENDGR